MTNSIKSTFVLGFNFKNANTKIRNEVFIDNTTKQKIYEHFKINNIKDVVVLNTCNRTEVYGIGNEKNIEKILKKFVPKISENQNKLTLLKGEKAINYIFNVSGGLNSQIIGDLEILNQFKTAFINAKANGLISGYFERLANTCIQASKDIRTNTKLTSGITSFSYAVVHYLKLLKNIENKKILLIGLGEMGLNVAKNVSTYLPKNQLFITNRTEKKLTEINKEIDFTKVDFNTFKSTLNNFDVIITSLTKTNNTVITKNNFSNLTGKIIIDLSVPFVVENSLRTDKSLTFLSLDALSETINKSLENRKKYIPIAEKIIFKYVHEFVEWTKIYEQKSDIKKWKDIVNEIAEQCPHLKELPKVKRASILKKSVSKFVLFLKENIDENNNKQMLENFLKQNNEKCCQLYKNKKQINQACAKCLS